MGNLGFNGKVPANWNKWWLAMWAVTAPVLVGAAFVLPFVPWVAATVVGFLVPELISLVKQDDSLPPLTHTIRHFLPNWLAFPMIYFFVGAIGATWLDLPRPLHVGALVGVLGWLTDHFSVTYSAADPFPYSNRARRVAPQVEERRMPA
jgi:hypothetical protein